MNVMSASHTNPHKKTHLLLDLDGTLIHSGNFMTSLKFIAGILPHLKHGRRGLHGWSFAWKHLRKVNHALKHGATVTNADLTNFERMIHEVERHLNCSRLEASQFMLNALTKAYPKILSDFTPLHGAAEFVEWAQKRYTLILATNPVWPIELVKDRMERGGIMPASFKWITTVDRMHSCKPNPKYYEEILKQEGITPDQCMHIGNEPKMDLPARSAGIPVFIVHSHQGIRELPKQNPAQAIAWSGDFENLKKLLSEV